MEPSESVLSKLGYICHQQNKIEEAVEYYCQSLEVYQYEGTSISGLKEILKGSKEQQQHKIINILKEKIRNKDIDGFIVFLVFPVGHVG